MNALPANAMRAILTACALAAEITHLGWEHLHGGVAAHHLLDRADLPAISNWWGLLLIPALTWFLVGRIQRRTSMHARSFAREHLVPPAVLAGFLGALAWGAALALAFMMKFEGVQYIFLGLFAISVFVPTYRAEYVLGFVLGMTFTFGAVLPTIVALVIASFSRMLHWLFGLAWHFIRHGRSPRPLPRNWR
jgi:hypothetical protein